jgi:hypothetical protein
MPTVKIDDVDYELDDMSDEAKNNLQAIQYVDQELLRVQMQAAALQTARNAYGRALANHLGSEETEEEPKLDIPDDLTFD